MLLHGAPLANPDSREKFGLKTRFRVVARDVGDYTGEPVVELEEMVVETPIFSWEDYLKTRVFHLLLTIFYYEGNVEEAFEFAREHGIKPYNLVVRMQQLLDQAPAGFRKVIDDFLQESRQELFSTREECTAWAVENMEGLIDGSAWRQPAEQVLDARPVLRDAGRPGVPEARDRRHAGRRHVR
jgi:hypothetical protein